MHFSRVAQRHLEPTNEGPAGIRVTDLRGAKSVASGKQAALGPAWSGAA